MKRVSGVLLLMLFGISTKAQNLVPNSSFEDYLECPTTSKPLSDYITHWLDATNTSVDYFHACGTGSFGAPNNFIGWQVPRTGDAYVGCGVYADSVPDYPHPREYIEVELNEELAADTSSYCVEFYVSYGQGGLREATSSIGAYLSNNYITGGPTDTLNYDPQIVNDPGNMLDEPILWMKIAGTFSALGGEKFITIGNFYPNELTILSNFHGTEFVQSYYYIDDVSVMKCSQVSTSLHSIAQEVNVQLNPNPVSNELQITINGLVGNAKIEITNVLGQIVFSQNVKATNSFHQAVDVSSLPSSLYLVMIDCGSKRVAQKLVKQ